MYKVMKGNEVTAYAAMLSSVDVIPAYPITPSTLFPEKISELIANGEMNATFIPTESEHSAISVAIGASASGSRVMTATASQGLAYMHEMLAIASGMRLPIVMAIGNRAISAPLNIWNDQQDSIDERNSGWIQLYAENNQEILDLTIAAFKISENEKVHLPVMICMDAFLLTHTMEAINIPDKKEVTDFIGKNTTNRIILDTEKPATLGSFASPEYYTEFRHQVTVAMEAANSVIFDIFSDFKKRFNRNYDVVEPYRLDDAELIFVSMGAVSGTIKDAVDVLREQGKKAGLLRLVAFRPFPSQQIKKYLSMDVKIAVIDRNVTPGYDGSVLYAELRSILYDSDFKPEIIDFIAGLGGRDMTIDDFIKIYTLAMEMNADSNHIVWEQLKPMGEDVS
ncbi:MAG: pyruvate ferredoxin oxidoreductase [Candidatus Thermoplasmatota archaeon]|jgi:pyruvate ferredoxin oxidoreductase alpha subunit|nr:pyruvate ferredoxin oxidoreductase [Candidatus Thermoplasmatota archaeon]